MNEGTVGVSGFGDGTQGEGRFLVDQTQASTGTICSIGTTGPVVLTNCGPTWPASTVGTALMSSIAGPSQAPQSFTVTGGTGTSGIGVGTHLVIADPYEYEQVVVTATTPSLQAIFRYPHPIGATVTAGGLAGWYIALNADVVPTNYPGLTASLVNPQHYLIPIIQSTSTSTLQLWLQSPSSGWVAYRGQWTSLNNGYTVYPGAQVTSVMQNQQLSNTLTLEVPVGAFALNDVVLLPQYHNTNVFAGILGASRIFPQVGGGNPAALWMPLRGLWVGDGFATDTAFEVDNYTPATVYKATVNGHSGTSGTKTGPWLMRMNGVWDSYLYAPQGANPGNIIRSEDTTQTTNIMLQNTSSGYMLMQSDPLNRRWLFKTYYGAGGQAGINADTGTFFETLFTPLSSSATCIPGQFADDTGYHYVCVESNHWRRVPLTDF